MRRFITVLTVVLSLLATVAVSAQVRGKARLQGIVTEQGSGKAVEGATVTVAPGDGSTAPIVVKTNSKGRWSALGLTGGQWNVDIEAKGYEASRGAVSVSEVQMVPPIKTELAPVVQQEEAATVNTGGVPQEIVDAVNLGQELMAAEKYKEAIVELEKALPALPDNMGLKQVTAQAYYKAGELKKAIEMLEAVTASAESNNGIVLLLTNLYLENNQLDEAKARLATLPADAITDPTVYMNIGILFLNKNNPAEAVTYLTSAVDMDMTRADTLYYRGLAYLQQKKTAEAKVDFEKVLALAPDSPEGRDAKQLIDSLK
ncbi:MAG: tetratricopeptide repeat protein [Thermoanaerobaculia bacterium]